MELCSTILANVHTSLAAALALARIGDAPRAKALAEELEKSYPTNTMLRLNWLPTINASIEIGKGNSSQAAVDLEPAMPYESGFAGASINYLDPVCAGVSPTVLPLPLSLRRFLTTPGLW